MHSESAPTAAVCLMPASQAGQRPPKDPLPGRVFGARSPRQQLRLTHPTCCDGGSGELPAAADPYTLQCSAGEGSTLADPSNSVPTAPQLTHRPVPSSHSLNGSTGCRSRHTAAALGLMRA